jgi:hypothetical protein
MIEHDALTRNKYSFSYSSSFFLKKYGGHQWHHAVGSSEAVAASCVAGSQAAKGAPYVSDF